MQTASYRKFKNTSHTSLHTTPAMFYLTFLLSSFFSDLKLIQLWLSFYLKLNVSKEAALNTSKPLMRCCTYFLTVRLMPLINRSKQDFIQKYDQLCISHRGSWTQRPAEKIPESCCVSLSLMSCISRTLNALLSPRVVSIMFYNQPLCLNLVWTTFFSTKLLIQVVYSNLLC